MQNSVNWKKLSSKYILKNKYLGVLKRKYLLPNNKVIDDFYQIVSPDYVIGIVLYKNKILIQQHFGRGINELLWEFPGGTTIENKENVFTAIKREVYEETGLVVETLNKNPYKLYPQPNTMLAKAYIVILRKINGYLIRNEKTEFVKNRWISINTLKKRIGTKGYNSMNLVCSWYVVNSFLEKNSTNS